MIKLQRPLGIFFVTKDDIHERILYMYPYVIEAPLENVEEEIQLDTNSILVESNKLVDGQITMDDSDGDAGSSFERSSTEEINKMLSSHVKTIYKNETLTKSTSAINEDKENAKIRHNWRNQLINNSVVKQKNGTNNTLIADGNRREEIEINKRRDKKNRLPTKIIAAMLRPFEDVCGVPFEVKIDKVRYVCNPWHIRLTAQCIAVVFVLHSSCSDKLVEAYQNLSRKLAIAIETEHFRCGYLREEMQKIQPYLDRAEDYNYDEVCDSINSNKEYIPYADIEKTSSLGRTLRQVFEDVYTHGIVDVFINDCIQVGFCVDPQHSIIQNPTAIPLGDFENINTILQPYHTLIFFEDCVPGPDANPYVLRFFQHYDIEHSLNEISLFSRMPLQQVKAVACHYILWGCARIIFPLCNTNIYSTMESTPTTKAACSAFRKLYGPDVGLGSILSAFHPPISLGQFLEEKSVYSTIKIKKQMLIFLLRNNYIVQLHKFPFLMPPDSKAERFQKPVSEVDLNFLSNRIKTQIRQFKQTDESIRNALLRISVDIITAGISEADYFWFLSTFISFYSFLNGEYHIEAIMCHKQLDRSAVIRILDLFSDIIVVLISQVQFPTRHTFV